MSTKEISQYIERLETKISFQEITIEDLNQSVIQLQSEVLKLKEQLSLIAKKIQTNQISNIANLSEETPPPHY